MNSQDHEPSKSRLFNLLESVSKLKKKVRSYMSKVFGYKNSKNTPIVKDPEAQKILKNIMQFSELDASDVMVPKLEIIAASNKLSVPELHKLFIKEEHSRLPIYGDSLDQIEGFIHVKDMMKAVSSSKKKQISTMIRPLIFVPLTVKVTDLLNKMKQSKTHIAIVLDEYGETAGLVTIEDIVEQIFGEINDEYDSEASHLVKEAEGVYTVNATIKIIALERLLNISMDLDIINEDFDTLGGMMISHFHYIPEVGEKMQFKEIMQLEVLEGSNRKVKKVKLTLI